jgi:DNA-binding transcriptional regulator GbsR (MarR family)
MTFIQLLQSILHKTIDEVEETANQLTEDTVEQDEDKLDVSAFDFIINIVTNMKNRYLSYKDANESPSFDERVTILKLVEDEEDDNGDGGLH